MPLRDSFIIYNLAFIYFRRKITAATERKKKEGEGERNAYRRRW